MTGVRAYIRESTTEQGSKFGPDAQRSAILAACRELELATPTHWYTDLVSGTGKVVRDELRQAIAAAGEYDVLVCYDTSRFARDERDAFNFEHDMHAAGVRIYYAAERVWSDDRGEGAAIAKGIFHVLNAQYSRTLSRKVADGYAAKFATTGAPGGTLPWGYRWSADRRALELTDDAKVRAQALRLYATGEYSSRTLADELNRRGHRIYGRPFSQWSIIEILRNPIAIGVTRRHAGTAAALERSGVVAPIVSREVWSRCQQLRAARRTSDGPTRAGTFVLSRIAVHDACGARLHGVMRRLRAGTARALAHRCAVPFNRDEEPLERAISAWIGTWTLDARLRARLHAFVSGARPSVDRAAVERRLGRARTLFLLGDIDDAAYERERAAAARDLETPAPARTLVASAAQIRDAWPDASIEARRALIGLLCDRVILGDGAMELVIHERYRALIGAIAAPSLRLPIAAPNHAGRGRYPRNEERQRWARRDSRPASTLLVTVDAATAAEHERWAEVVA